MKKIPTKVEVYCGLCGVELNRWVLLPIYYKLNSRNRPEPHSDDAVGLKRLAQIERESLQQHINVCGAAGQISPNVLYLYGIHKGG